MFGSAAGKMMRAGRATVFLVGLAVILALLFGVATTAMGANGNPFLLGKPNVASLASTLVNKGPGPALSLRVAAVSPPWPSTPPRRSPGSTPTRWTGSTPPTCSPAAPCPPV